MNLRTVKVRCAFVKTGKTAVVLLLFLICFGAVFCACETAGDAASFGVILSGEHVGECVRAWQDPKTGNYTLFLPSGVDRTELTVSASAGGVEIDGTLIKDNEKTSIFKEDGPFAVKAGKAESELNVLQSDNVPAMFITTESGGMDRIHADKEHKEKGTVSLIENGVFTVEGAQLRHIKGRGHLSWTGSEKKPYNLKFEEKIDLFGMGSTKRWALLAEIGEYQLTTKTLVGTSLAQQMSFSYTPECRPVELYLNGEYYGVYLLSEKAEVGRERLNIYDLDKANEEANPGVELESCKTGRSGPDGQAVPNGGILSPGERGWYQLGNDPADISKGYFFELTTDIEHHNAFCSALGQFCYVRAPEFASEREMNYLADFYQKIEDAVYSADGYNGDGQYYLDLIDAPSFADMYILRELYMDYDAGVRSTFVYKPTSENRLFAGPVWDYDGGLNSYGGAFGVDYSIPAFWWANSRPLICCEKEPDGDGLRLHSERSIFSALYRHEDFRDVVRERWNALSGALAGATKTLNKAGALYYKALAIDGVRWENGADRSYLSKLMIQNSRLDQLQKILNARVKVLDIGFSESAAMLYYDSNGGKGVTFNTQVLTIGGEAVLKGAIDEEQSALIERCNETDFSSVDGLMTAPSDEYRFAGWNTKPDGSGSAFSAGDTFTVNERTVVLYAQWEKKQ